jgi:hypothetical protein
MKVYVLIIICVCSLIQVGASFYIPMYGNYCGPGYGDATYTTKPTDELDNICMQHDLCYDQFGGVTRLCDVEFVIKLEALYSEKGEFYDPALATVVKTLIYVLKPVSG